MLKPADSVIVRQPTQFGRSNVVLTGHVISATATKVKVELEDGVREFPASQVAKASAGEVNNFFSDREEIIQQFQRR